MAVCDYCHQEMHEADGCILETIQTVDGVLEPVKYGAEYDPIMEAFKEGFSRRCGDCACMPGFYHHVGCDIEECPRCHGQLISCDCLVGDES